MTKQTAENQTESLLCTACRALSNFFETGNYSKTVEVGNFLIELIENSDSFNDAKINLHLLIGKAKFHMGQYSDGMDHIEIALLSIPDVASDYEKERSTACWYLIPRIRYLNTCYGILKWNAMTVVATPVMGTGFLILTTIPFYFEYKKNKGEKQILTPRQLSHRTTLASTSRSLELIVNRCRKWSVLIQPQLKEALSGVKTTFNS